MPTDYMYAITEEDTEAIEEITTPEETEVGDNTGETEGGNETTDPPTNPDTGEPNPPVDPDPGEGGEEPIEPPVDPPEPVLIDISTDAEFTMEQESYEYTGYLICPIIHSYYPAEERNLVSNEEYQIEYENCSEVGTGVVIIHGVGLFTGEVRIEFEIIPLNIVNTEVDCGETDENGCVTISNFRLLYMGRPLIRDTDYTVVFTEEIVDRVTYTTATFTGIGNYRGEATSSFITNRDIRKMSSLTYILSRDTYIYDGKPKVPVIVVKDEQYDYTLIEGQDYSLDPISTIEAGEGIIRVHSLNHHYSGNHDVKYAINPANLSGGIITCGHPDDYGCYDIENIEVYVDGRQLEYGIEYAYTVEYTEEDYSLYANLTIRPISHNYTGTFMMTYKVRYSLIDISTQEISIDCSEFIFNTHIQKPNVITDLIEDKDYTVVVDESSSAGTYEIRVQGIEHFYNFVSFTYTILPLNINNGILDTGEEDETGCIDIDNIQLSVEGVTLINTEDYEVWYESTELENGFVGARVVLTGIGNYTGTYEFECLIKKKTIFAKRKIRLDNAYLFIRSYGFENAGLISGYFYLYDGEEVNERIKICSKEEFCGHPGAIKGWVDVGELDVIKVDENKQYRLYAGDEVKLWKQPIYPTFASNKPCAILTGRYYVSDNVMYNKRLKLCTSEDHVFIDRRVIGWVPLEDV